MIWIGIDPGVNTGLAIWDGQHQEFIELSTIPIHRALFKVQKFYQDNKGLFDMKVIFEDAWQRKGYYEEKYTNAKAQGAGSVKRDCTIWKDFLTDMGIPYWAKPPQKGMTKVDSEWFRMVTGWKGRTSNHARDAAMLVLGK